MAAHTWYEICVDSSVQSVRGSLDGARGEINRLRLLHPTADLIFVRHYSGGKGKFRVLHYLTVSKGSTADERRQRAIAQGEEERERKAAATHCPKHPVPYPGCPDCAIDALINYLEGGSK